MGDRRVVGYEKDGSPIYGSKIKGPSLVSRARERTRSRAGKAKSSIVSGIKKRVTHRHKRRR